MKKYAWTMTALCLAPFFLCQILFLFSPKMFYFRSYEYFMQIAFETFSTPPRWEGYEYDNETRENFFHHQDKKFNVVSTDEEGFRSVPFKSDAYPIAIGGDCNMYGAGLSDNETLPWRLAERLGVPVFNAAHSGFYVVEGVMKKKCLQKVRLAVDSLVERHLYSPSFHLGVERPPGDEVWRYPHSSAWGAKWNITAERFGPHYLLRRAIKRIHKDFLEMKAAGWNPKRLRTMSLIDHRGCHKTEEDIAFCVSQITKKKKWMDQLGVKYLFIPIPCKYTIYNEGLNDCTVNFSKILVSKLRKNGVYAVDLDSEFRKYKGKKTLFRNFEAHWTPEGVDLASKKIADYIRENHLLD